jgi:serine/threonine-protein kinase RsbW
MPDTTTLTTKAVLENVPLAIDFVTQQARAAGFDEQAVYQIQVAVDEACANIVDHAYAGMESGDMEVSCSLNDGTFVIRVRDWGTSFNPDAIEDPDREAPLEERALGGLGLFLIRQFMEGVQFTFDPKLGNELVMTKRI